MEEELYFWPKTKETELFRKHAAFLDMVAHLFSSPIVGKFSLVCSHSTRMIEWFEGFDEMVWLCIEKIKYFCEKNLAKTLEKQNEIDYVVIEDMHNMMVIRILEEFDELQRATYPPYLSKHRPSEALKSVVDEYRSIATALHKQLIDINTCMEEYLKKTAPAPVEKK